MAHLEISGLDVSYGSTRVLTGIDLQVARGELVGLVGPSGSGKSTLLRALVGLVPPTAGQVVLEGKIVDYARKDSLRALRDHAAIVFQQYNLFQNMTVLDNITVTPVKVRGRLRAEAEADARALLSRVGLSGKESAYPDQLSGGQQQRVAIARALIHKPKILVCDEPTAALDHETGMIVMKLIRELAVSDDRAVIVVTHDNRIFPMGDRVAHMDDGHIESIVDGSGRPIPAKIDIP